MTHKQNVPVCGLPSMKSKAIYHKQKLFFIPSGLILRLANSRAAAITADFAGPTPRFPEAPWHSPCHSLCPKPLVPFRQHSSHCNLLYRFQLKLQAIPSPKDIQLPFPEAFPLVFQTWHFTDFPHVLPPMHQ